MGSVSSGPITAADMVEVDGTNWAQVNLFIGLSWGDINAVCPAGICVGGGTLNGYDMTNFLWPDTDDMNAVFNDYIDWSELGPGPDAYSGPPGSFAAAFFCRCLAND